MASTERLIVVIAAFIGAVMHLQGCGSNAGYKIEQKDVYSNSKYLADIQKVIMQEELARGM